MAANELNGQVDREGLCAPQGSAAETDLLENDRQSQGLFGVVVGRWHILDLEECEEILSVAFRIGKSLTQILGILLGQRLPSKRVEDTLEPGDVSLCRLERDAPALAALIDAAADREELLERLAEATA